MQQTQNQPAGAVVADAVSTALNAAAQNLRPASVLFGNRKFLAAAGTIGMAVLNALFVKYGINAQIPPDATIIDVVIQGLQLAAYYSPSILTYLTTRHYITENVKQDVAHTQAVATTPAVATPAPAAPATPPAADPGVAEAKTGSGQNISLVKDRLAGMLSMVDKDFWSYLDGQYGEDIQKSIKHLQDVNPNLTSQQIADVVNQYANTKMTPQDCQAVLQFIGLPDVLTNIADRRILLDFKAAADRGTLALSKIEDFHQAARRYCITNVITEAAQRVQNEYANLPLEARQISRARALMEFGYSMEDAMRMEPQGAQVYVWKQGGYREFNPYGDAGYDAMTMQPYN